MEGESKSHPVISSNALEIVQSQNENQMMQEVKKEVPINAFKMEDDFAEFTEPE